MPFDAVLRPGNRVFLLRDGKEAFPRMLEAIARAKRFILLEMYTFADDFVGQRFARALGERARQGIDVRVLYDAFGSRDTGRDFFGAMRGEGIRVAEFNSFKRVVLALRFLRRNHRKILAVDGEVAFVGGMNLTREYADPAEGGSGWRDTAVEIQGPVAADLTRMIFDLPGPSVMIPIPAERKRGIPAFALSSHRLADRWTIGRWYRRTLARARERVWIANPYFLPSIGVRRELRRAARRGVDVRLLLPARSDAAPALYASQRLFARLLKWGVRLFEWPGPMMHAKTAVIDGTWSTVGSYNLDHLSFKHNIEVTVVMTDAAFGREMEAAFERDCSASREILADEWRRRGWVRRLAETVFYPFRMFF